MTPALPAGPIPTLTHRAARPTRPPSCSSRPRRGGALSTTAPTAETTPTSTWRPVRTPLVVSGISTGDYFLVAIAEPTVAHEVDADPVTVAYAVPAAAVTHTPRTLVAYAVTPNRRLRGSATSTHQGRIAVDHTVNADPVTVAYAVPQPSVTHTLPDSHTVDADPVAVAYAVPQPTVTYTPRVPVDHTVDADPVAVAYAVPQPASPTPRE